MPTFTNTSTNSSVWTNFTSIYPDGLRFKEGDFVKWVFYDNSNYGNATRPSGNTFEKLTQKKLQILKMYKSPNEHLCTVRLVDDPENKLYNVAICELVHWSEKKFTVNKKLVAKINNISRDLRLIDGNFSEIVSSIVDKYLLKPLLKSEFKEIKATIKPIVSNLEKLEDDESNYILEELQEMFLALSKDVVPDPQEKKKSEMEELRKKVLKDPF